MQVSEAEVHFREDTALSLSPLAQNSAVQLSPSPLPASTLPASSILFDLCSRFGFIAAASSDSGFTLASSKDVKSAFQRNETAQLGTGTVSVQTPAKVHFLRFAYAELYLVAVLENGSVCVYSLKSLVLQGNTTPLSTYTLPAPATDLLPNPSDKPELLAVLLSTGQVALFDLTSAPSSNAAPSLLFASSATSACWSVRGKQLVCGCSDGSLVQYAPDGAEKGQVGPAPSLASEGGPHSVIDVRWLENDVFFVTLAPNVPADDGLPPLMANYIITRTKTSIQYARLVDDPTQPFGTFESRATRRLVDNLKNAAGYKHLLVLAASNSPDVALLACDASTSDWAVLELDDNARASLPSSAHNSQGDDNTCPLGLRFDVNASPYNDGPALWAYTSDGTAILWHVKSSAADVQGCTVQAEDLATASDQPLVQQQQPQQQQSQQHPATPAAKPFGSSAVPSFGGGGAPAFGQASFGKSAFGSPGFGTPAAAAPATPTAQPTGGGGSAFGGFSITPSGGAGGGGFGGFAAASSNTPSAAAKPAGFGSFGTPSGGGSVFGSAPAAAGGGASPFSASSTFGKSTFGAGSGSNMRSGGGGMGEDDEEDEVKPTAPGLGMDADELEPQAKGDASASLGFGGFGLGQASSSSSSSQAQTQDQPEGGNKMFGSFGTSSPAPAASGTPSAFSAFGSKPAASAFGAPSSPASSPFGKPAAGGGFGFGSAASSSPAPATGGFSFAASKPAEAPAASAPASTGGFSFAASNPAEVPTSIAPASTSGFSFAASKPAETPAPAAPASTGGFSFAASKPAETPAPAAPASTGGFSFAASKPAETPATSAPASTGGFSFAASKPAETPATSAPASPSGFSFAASKPAETPATSAPASPGGFSFAAAKPTEAPTTSGSAPTPASTSLSFGTSKPAEAPSSGFSFASKPATSVADKPAATSAPSAFASFGKAPAAPSFSFGSAPKEPVSAPTASAPESDSGASTPASSGTTSPGATADAQSATPFSFSKPKSPSPLAQPVSLGASDDSGPSKSAFAGLAPPQSAPSFSSGSKPASPSSTAPTTPTEKKPAEDGSSSTPTESKMPSFGGFGQQQNQQSTSSSATTIEKPKMPSFAGSGSADSQKSSSPASMPTEEKPKMPSFAGFGSAQPKTDQTKTSPFAGLGGGAKAEKPAFGGFGSLGKTSFSPAASGASTPTDTEQKSAMPTIPSQETKDAPKEQPSFAFAGNKAQSSLFGKQPSQPPQPSSSSSKGGPSFSFGASKPASSSSADSEKKAPSPSPSPLAGPGKPASPAPSTSSQPKTPTDQAAAKAEGLGAEFLKLIKETDNDLQKLAQQAEQKLAHASQFKEPLQPVDNFPNSFDDGEWTMGDLAHLDQVSNRLHEVLDEARSSQKTANAHLLELQNSCVKAQLKGAEIQRFFDNISNPDFHRQLQAQQLGPEQAEMQQHLRSLVTTARETLDQLEGQVEHVHTRMTQKNAGSAPLRISSLEMIHQTMRNLSFSIQAKHSELTELSTRMNMLVRPIGRGKGGMRALPSSSQAPEPLFKGAVSEEIVGRIKQSAQSRASLRNMYLAARSRPMLTRADGTSAA